jgi:D-glycero-D-manno-heptose 1,7-bisphosphate phosphatase
LELLPGAKEALEYLHGAGFMNIVVTNQPDVATGKVPRNTVDAIHKWMLEHLAIDEVRVCYETESQETGRYKPAPGMLLDAARDHGIDLAHSHMIGDRWRDVGAGNAAGCFTYYIQNDYLERQPDKPDKIVASLAEAAQSILTSVNESKSPR